MNNTSESEFRIKWKYGLRCSIADLFHFIFILFCLVSYEDLGFGRSKIYTFVRWKFALHEFAYSNVVVLFM